MSHHPRKRRFRCALCLAVVVAVTVFLISDALRFEGGGTTPGPGYLVVWLGMVLAGALALLALAADLVWSGLRQRRAKPGAVPVASEVGSTASLLPRA